MRCRNPHGLWLVLVLCLLAAPAAAQNTLQDQPLPAIWIASISAGLALTKGNSDTSTVNLAFDAVRDDRQRFVFTTSGLVIRGDQDDELRVDRRWLDMRLDARVSERAGVFAQTSYLRDRFKQINYLIAPTAGVALRATRTTAVDLVVDGSLGAVIEKNQGRDVERSPALAAGQRLIITLNRSARVTQAFRTFVKLNDLGDVLYTFSGGLAASVTEHSELKVELIDTFKNEPPDPSLRKNDLSMLVSIVHKF